MQDTFARATHSAARPSARATIGYLVYNGYLGNEKADSLTKRGANNTDATLLKLQILKVTWDVAIRERTKHNIWTKWRDAPPSLVYKIPYRRAPRLAYRPLGRVRRASKGILHTTPSHFTRVWRKKFSKSIHNLNRGNLRQATMFLTGHVTLNYHLKKYSIKLIKSQKLAATALQRKKRPIIILDSVRSGRLRGVQSLINSIWASQK